MPATRRRVLRTIAGAVGVAGVAGLAGCSSSCPDHDRPTPSEMLSLSADPGDPFETAPPGEWRGPHGDAGNTGYGGHSLPEEEIGIRWRIDLPLPGTDSGGLSASAPTVGEDVVLVADEDRVHALSKRTGDILWQSETIVPTFQDALWDYWANTVAPANGPDGHAYVGTADGLVALDAADGSIRWTADDLSDVATPAIVDGVVYAAGANEVVAVAPDGTERWRRPSSRGSVPHPPAIGSGRVVYVADASIVALDAADGTVVWERQRQSESQVVIEGSTCYVGNYQGLHAIDLASGQPRWTFNRGDGRELRSPVVAPETIYALEQPGEAGAASFALERGNAEPSPRWCSYVGSGVVTAASRELALTTTSLGTGPDAAQSIVALTADLGVAQWALESGSHPREWVNPPALLEGALVVTTRGGTVAAIGGPA